MPRSLTPRQVSILEFIAASTRENGAPPSRREIAAHFGITAGGLQKQIKALEAKGALRLPAGRAARGLRIVGTQGNGAQVRLPLLGSVRAGVPVEAFESVESHLVFDPAVAGAADFALRVRGDSMEPSMREGDLALVQKTSQASSGETVIALVEGEEATVKLFRRQGTEVWLEALNARYQPIRGRSFEIVGRVLGLVRSFSNGTMR